MIVYQRPNVLLLIGLSLSLLGMIISANQPHHILHALSVAAWISWGYDELRYGVNGFRRVLGAAVIGWQVVGLVR